MRESEIEKQVTKYAEDNGLLAYKFTSPCVKGVPDHMYACPDGTVFFIEFKKRGGTISPSQQREIQKLKDSCVPVYVVDSVYNGSRTIDLFLNIC